MLRKLRLRQRNGFLVKKNPFPLGFQGNFFNVFKQPRFNVFTYDKSLPQHCQSNLDVKMQQRRIQNTVKHLRCRILRKQLTAYSLQLTTLSLQPLTILAECSILDVWQGSEYTSLQLADSITDDMYRMSRPEVFYKKGVLRSFTKRIWQRCFPVSFVKFRRIPFYIEHLWWLLLYV